MSKASTNHDHISVSSQVDDQSEDTIPVSPEPDAGDPDERVVRLKRSITIVKKADAVIDETVISPHFYNSFAYTLMSPVPENKCFTIGVTSANHHEGKTLVASNLAVSLAMSMRRKTVLVDLHRSRPSLHKVFGFPAGPGLSESLDRIDIPVWETQVHSLYLLTAGSRVKSIRKFGTQATERSVRSTEELGQLSLEEFTPIRDILYTMREEFTFVVVDLPPLREDTFPAPFASQIDGFAVVVRKDKTKTEELNAILRRIDERQYLGFVLNSADGSAKGKGFVWTRSRSS